MSPQQDWQNVDYQEAGLLITSLSMSGTISEEG